MWNAIGLLVSLAIAVFALLRSTATVTNYYEREVYGMTATSHRRYAAAAAILALLFAAGLLWPSIPTTVLLGVAAVVAILYLSSFVRGASGEDE